jgi:glycosyltransferase
MKISIITVCFNSAATIADTLKTVDTQTWPDIEHLIIDGGSRDDTLRIVDEHRQPWRHVLSESDRGIYDAMNKGIALATGDYVGFLNADDMFATGHAVAAIADRAIGGADVVYGDLVYVSAQDTSRVIRHWHSGSFAPASLRRGWMPPHPTVYTRRSVLQQVGGFDTNLKVAADYDLMLRCLVRPRATAAHVPEVLVRMRTGGLSNGSLASILRKSREDLDVIRRHHLGGWLTLAYKNLRKLPQFMSMVFGR